MKQTSTLFYIRVYLLTNYTTSYTRIILVIHSFCFNFCLIQPLNTYKTNICYGKTFLENQTFEYNSCNLLQNRNLEDYDNLIICIQNKRI